MKEFGAMGYIRKFQGFIILLCILAGVIGYLALSRMQTYTASAIIRYANEEAAQGLAPDGSPIDTTEIYSAKVISDVFSRMGLDYAQYSVDDLRSRVKVAAVRTKEKAALDEAITAKGEETVEDPVEFQVSFEARYGDAEELKSFAWQFLDEMLDSYISYYGQEHINNASPAINDISNLNSHHYDYLEKAEILSSSISAARDALKKRQGSVDEQFRSTQTGYSFLDLQREFATMRNVRISSLYSFILGNRVTQDLDVLLAKYETRIDGYELDNQKSGERIELIRGIIDSYVNMMRESGNTDISFEYILQTMNEDWYEDEEGKRIYQTDQKVAYDTLLEDYAGERIEYENALVDIAYCQYILDVYRGGTPQSSAEDQQKAQEMIDSLAEEVDTLHQILEKTNQEYNEYIGAKNISLLAGIAASERFSLGRYVFLIVLVFGVIGCVGAIVAGRLIDIFEYYVYTDRSLGIANRAACDRQMSQYEKRLLGEHFVCISVKAENVKAKNRVYGRKAADQMLQELVQMLKGCFLGEPDTFLGANNFEHYLIFSEHMTAGRARSYAAQLARMAEEYNAHASCAMEYTIGIAEAGETGVYQIRDLVVAALQNASGPEERAVTAGAVSSEEPAERQQVLHGT